MTAGNAPGVNDGAAALVVMSRGRRDARSASTPLARIVGAGDQRPRAEAGDDDAGRSRPEGRSRRPAGAGDVDLFEINEAFSVQAVAVMRELGIDPAQGERARRRGGARPSDRRQRRARADDAALRDAARGT